MKKSSILILFALCPLVPAAGRFAHALILAAAVILIFSAGLLFREISRQLNFGRFGPVLEMTALAATASLFSLLLSALFPLLQLTLGIYIFLTAFSYLVLISIDNFSGRDITFFLILPFIPGILFFGLIRELLGFGTISLPHYSGLIEIQVLPAMTGNGIGFWGTSAAALILLALLLALTRFVTRKLAVYKGVA